MAAKTPFKLVPIGKVIFQGLGLKCNIQFPFSCF